jgi:PAS domain S-box-containing protein
MNEIKAHNSPDKTDIGTLINSFRHFNEAAANLNLAYQRLEEKLADLTQQLEEKDKQLYGRLRELDRVTRYLNSLVESLSSGVVAIDLDGKITIFNRAAANMVGISAESAIGKLYLDVLSAEGLPCGALQTLMSGPELRGLERELAGGCAKVKSQTIWVVDSFGDRIGVMELFDDVTVLRSLEERLQQQKTLSALGEMAAGVAHELRNPLAGIGGFAAILKDELAEDERLGKMAGNIVQGVKNLDRVASNLLFLTRQTTLQPENLDLKNVISETCELLGSEAVHTGLHVAIEAHLPKENVPVYLDPMLIRLILTNLGRNAMQAVKDDGCVTFRLTWKLLSNRIDIEVADNGAGISAENLAKLFSPFFTTKDSGTGLGLAQVKKAVELHRGEIKVESEVSKGSSFKVTLPIRMGLA